MPCSVATPVGSPTRRSARTALTSYAGEAGDITADLLSSYIQKVESGALSIPRGPVFPFDELREAHALMDDNKANGKIVVTLETL